ncbi:hypothetical protein [Streptomyces sp. NPDC088847]|uniref:hypothetical protein n=1 Tax=Streptomyces sp. NPDC088847 TaxID=3365909 RepID=UPI0038295590
MHALSSDTVTLAAGVGGQILGTITVVGIAGPATIAFVAGLKGSDTIKINDKKKALTWGVIIGQLWIAAGGTLADIASGVSGVSQGVLGGSDLWGSAPGQGGVCLTLFVLAYAFRWKRMVWPALFGLALGIGMADAGGIWSIGANVFKMLLAAVVSKVM